MPSPRESHSVARSVIIPRTGSESGLAIPISQWNQIMKRIEECTEPPNHLQSLGWACVGAVVSTLPVAATLPLGVDFKSTVGPHYGAITIECALIVVTIAATLGSLFSFFHVRMWQKYRLDVRRMIIEDMANIRDSFRVIAVPGPPQSAGPAGSSA